MALQPWEHGGFPLPWITMMRLYECMLQLARHLSMPSCCADCSVLGLGHYLLVTHNA
jgi:hypothetical protein